MGVSTTSGIAWWCYLALACSCLVKLGTAFVIQPAAMKSVAYRYSRRTARFLSSSSDPADKKSRLAGNQREPTPQELEVMDEMIQKLANAKPYELPTSVQRAFRVISSPRFFVRIAELTDRQSNEMEKEKLIALASNLVATLEAVVSSAQEKLEANAKDVETVVKAAAEPDTGEFLVPLSPERIAAMQSAVAALDEDALQGDAFLSTVDAWMNKSHQDGLDRMVGILQKVLQLYAGRRIRYVRQQQRQQQQQTKDDRSNSSSSSSSSIARDLLDELLVTDSDQWDATVRQSVAPDAPATVVTAPLIAEIQQSMETTVLSLESGSMSQRVLAEYLQEMVKRVESVQASS